MDSFSGSFPLEFISFYLDMLTEDRNEATPEFVAEAKVEESVAQTLMEPEAGRSGETRVDAAPTVSNKPEGTEGCTVRVRPTSSPSTDESISAYIERTLQTLGCQGTGLDITFLPPTDPVGNIESQELETEKASESDPIPQVAADQGEKTLTEEESVRQTDVNSEAGFSTTKVEYFQTDTSDVEELLDSSGAETTKNPPILIPLDDMRPLGQKSPKTPNTLPQEGLQTQNSSVQVGHYLLDFDQPAFCWNQSQHSASRPFDSGIQPGVGPLYAASRVQWDSNLVSAPDEEHVRGSHEGGGAHSE